MLQVAFAGKNLVNGGNTLVDNPIYYEPGFNLMSPLEIESSKADYIYLLVRKRSDGTGSIFEEILTDNLTFTAKDATNGEPLITQIELNNLNTSWDPPHPLVDPEDLILLTIENQLDPSDPSLRVRIMDCYIKDTSDNTFLSFRVTVNSDNEIYFYYIPVERSNISDRNTFSAASREAFVKMSGASDFYILFSPYAWLKEDTKDKADFSYPENSIYYRRQKTYNEEDFTYSLVAYNYSFVPDLISVMNVPGYRKAGIILVDNLLYRNLIEQQSSAYADISIVGELSGIVDTFKVNFYT
jgi:hypothetical protein